MGNIWILVADSTRARMFSTEKRDGPLKEDFDLVNPEARMREQELTTDSAGRATNSATGVTYQYGQDGKHKPEAVRQFARQIAERLRQERSRGAFEKLYVMADPSFLGELRKTVDSSTKTLVAGTVDKNLTRGSVEEVRRALPDFL
ncbi:MAG: host attachment protein [Xanthomonadales bacterium]|nr:host attachment protein [Xanthomonadales bacterium]